MSNPAKEFNQIIFDGINTIKEIYQTVINDINKYIVHDIINPDFKIDNQTVSIVMTTHSRIVQTLFTLDTINNSKHKNVQVILIDDGNPIELDKLKKYPYRIDYIKIKDENRKWKNPCVNYNIGFRFVLGGYVIIQNAEVCHYGDVVSYVKDKIEENSYMIFDVLNTYSFDVNAFIHENSTNGLISKETFEKLINNSTCGWYQHHIHGNRRFHFLTAMTRKSFDKIPDGFDYDFSIGRSFDDMEFLVKILYVIKLNSVLVPYTTENVMGIHQHHHTVYLKDSFELYTKTYNMNQYMYNTKLDFFQKNGYWPTMYNHPEPEKMFKLTFGDS